MAEEEIQDNYTLSVEFSKENKDDKVIFSLKKKQFYYSIIGVFFLIFILTSTIYFFTPLKLLIPGFPDRDMKNNLISIQMKVDSIKNVDRINEQYFENIKAICNGEIITEKSTAKEISKFDPNQKFDSKLTKQEEDFREKVEKNDKYNTLDIEKESEIDYSFYTPIQGLVTSKFEPNRQHFGIDLVATENAPIKCIQSGTVIFSGWTSEDGYVITIQHQDNLISIYKHNSSLLKRIGENVLPGEVIALIGNTGELSQGAHLHLEIWQNGYPVDPEKVIQF
jgi:murein DD-endopeptidase MepM/ murein hydrolase activator NlpD